MKTLISTILSLIFLSLSIIHIYWGFGGKSGSIATIPTKSNNKPVINPGKTDCFVVALTLLSFGLLILIKSGLILFSLPDWLLNYGLWVIATIFLLRAMGEFKYIGLFKKIKTTKFGRLDTKFYSPLCLLIGVLDLILEFIS